MKKLYDGEYDAILLAAAGMKRMGWSEDIVTEYMSVEDCIPAVGQGALAIECRADDDRTTCRTCENYLMKKRGKKSKQNEHFYLKWMVLAKYQLLDLQQYDGTNIEFTGYIASPDATQIFKQTIINSDPVEAGKEVAKMLRAEGASEVIEKVKAEMDA